MSKTTWTVCNLCGNKARERGPMRSGNEMSTGNVDIGHARRLQPSTKRNSNTCEWEFRFFCVWNHILRFSFFVSVPKWNAFLEFFSRAANKNKKGHKKCGKITTTNKTKRRKKEVCMSWIKTALQDSLENREKKPKKWKTPWKKNTEFIELSAKHLYNAHRIIYCREKIARVHFRKISHHAAAHEK